MPAAGADSGAGFFDWEETWRRDTYRHDSDLEAVLAQMNAALAAVPYQGDSTQPYPTILVFGLPRSGTTLTYQLLANCLDIGYPDNIVARFWEAPWFGVAVSRAVHGRRRPCSYTSDYGRTVEPWAPHEFRYFWKRLLRLETLEDHLDFGPDFERVDRARVRDAVGRLQNAFGGPVVFKSLYFGQFLPALLEAITNPIIVYVERDLRDVALSILAARRAYYGRPDVWWSSFCPSYPELAARPFPEQIAHQVVELADLYEQRLAATNQDIVVRVAYSTLCTDPSGVVTAVRNRIRSAHGHDIGLGTEPPPPFTSRSPHVTDPDAEAVSAALDHLLRGRRLGSP